MVNNAVVTPSGNSVSTGFLGAMIMAVICGYFVRWMKTWKVNNTIQTIMPILIIPDSDLARPGHGLHLHPGHAAWLRDGLAHQRAR
ncbi:MAG: hypothetical protein ACLU0O_10910 [Collinsella sp.]